VVEGGSEWNGESDGSGSGAGVGGWKQSAGNPGCAGGSSMIGKRLSIWVKFIDDRGV